MSFSLERTTIGNVAKVVGGGTPSSKVEEYYGGDVSWITPKDLSGYKSKRISSGERNITDLGLNKSSAKLLPKGTVLLTSRAPIGYVAIADQELSTNQGFKSLILKDGYDPVFFYYLLKTLVPELQARATGSTFKEISGSSLKEVELSVPSETTQKRIASILSAFDSKIENNNQTNQTLE
ncbi:restriction endonuclease subunit S [Agarivorans sp. B2Z047]|uniref:restriction endonuclease subunit S n=1 Tax=Agarivorans sp. B2Z047 TaxID=2652721 RepID=UPI00128E490C|nr:restriction endonuclease subunit S [Agarivorans sp. B2Z047]MPW31899.1 restriction endonuclease subunit S [Agarivorans sp. B2Z047]UQN40982.1 restriction endonuclease subunit S [Agarivorans sp. B2Z047]